MKMGLIGLALALGSPVAMAEVPDDVLLIVWGAANPPHASASSVGMFSPVDGSYLGDLVPPDNERITYPNSIVVGPDRLLYISDSVYDSVFRYRLDGTFFDVFKGSDDGLDNVRGLHFLGRELLVANNPLPSTPSGELDYTHTAVLRFDLDGNELEPFIPPGTEISAWDIHPMGDLLLINDVQGFTPTSLRAYDHDANLVIPSILGEAFPTQITESHTPGNLYQFSFSGRIKEFNAGGRLRTINLPGLTFMAQGLAALEDGNFLVSNFNAGVYRYNAAGAPMGPVREGFGIYSTITRVRFCDGDIWFDGVLNVDDIERFVETYLANDPIADLAEPAGVWNVDDIDAFVDAFLAGCG